MGRLLLRKERLTEATGGKASDHVSSPLLLKKGEESNTFLAKGIKRLSSLAEARKRGDSSL
jgi:hypothetical protein